jgi:hypothetical protein
MSNPSKRKGTDFEVSIRDYFVTELGDRRIKRVAQAGSKDEGDIANFRIADMDIAVECKATDEYRSNLAGWVKEAQREAQNLGALSSIVVHKRKGVRAAQEQYVTCTLGDFFRMLHLSQGEGSVPT